MNSNISLPGTGQSLGHCARHPERPGIALCRRCGDSACRRCALGPIESLCLSCEERELEEITDRQRRRFKLRALASMFSLPIVLGILAELFLASQAARLGFRFRGAAFTGGASLGGVFSLMLGVSFASTWRGIGAWAEEYKSSLTNLHKVWSELPAEEVAEILDDPEEQRSELLALMDHIGPRVLLSQMIETGELPISPFWSALMFLLSLVFAGLFLTLEVSFAWSGLGLIGAAAAIVSIASIVFLVWRNRKGASEKPSLEKIPRNKP